MKAAAVRGRRLSRHSSPRPKNFRLPPRTYYLALAAIVVLGGVVRILAARGELWLDEIWSYRIAHSVNVAGVFTGIHSDNNHYLNTLYLRWIPEGTSAWVVYRLPAIFAGTLSILLAAAIAREASDRAALSAAAITAGSFLLVVYSSEARGYALAIVCAFGCVLLARWYLGSPRIGRAAAFGTVATLGLLAHLTFLHALAGLMAWTAVHTYRRSGVAGLGRTLTELYALPLAALAVLYWIDLRHLQLGGGPPTTPWIIGGNVLALSVGGPDIGAFRTLALIVASVLGLASIAAIRRTGSDLWILFVITIFVAPAVTFSVVDTDLIYERYLLVAAAFMLLSFGWLSARVLRRSLMAGVVLIALLLAGNVARTLQFIGTGRGSFVQAMTYAVQHAVQVPVTIGSDHDFRIGWVVEFYRRFVPGGEKIDYVEQPAWPPAGPEWFLRHRIEPEFFPEPEITVLRRARYRLVSAYPYAGLSGWHMALYHNALATDR